MYQPYTRRQTPGIPGEKENLSTLDKVDTIGYNIVSSIW